MDKMIAVRIPNDINDRLSLLAKQTGRTKTYYIREAILEHLEDLEDIYLAESRFESVKAGRSRTHTIDEVERDLDLASRV